MSEHEERDYYPRKHTENISPRKELSQKEWDKRKSSRKQSNRSRRRNRR